jgi:hypothetical protein
MAVEEIPVGLYLLRRIRELGCKTVQGLPGMRAPRTIRMMRKG